jgi:DHA1 family bicyclomycin/chloramphenicol resistance-like MFS transporter
MNELSYGLIFGANALAIMIVSSFAAKLSRQHSPSLLLQIGVVVLGISALAVLCCAVLPLPAWTLILPLFTGVGSLGLIFGNATTLALSAVPHAVGKASAILGAAQFILGAFIAPLVGLGGEETAVPMAITFTACAALAFVTLVFSRNRGAQPNFAEY